ncbi:MAG: hypothetical protein EYC67_10975 [Betaproteobacteria bacterium]|nr:MAG: hypothetical protein EYC67_10975 [Betaproteobacteria bacterium]
MNAQDHEHKDGVPCCPELAKDPVCDVLDFHYRTRHNTAILAAGRRVQVEVLIHARLERCPGPMTLGDLVYSTTLLPGEKVRLFTSDRRTQFSIDTESKVSYRHQQTSEERYYMSSMHDFMSDLSVRDSSSASSSSHGSTKGHAETSGALETIFGGPSVDVSGSYDASSTSSFVRELSQHASASDRRSEMATRTASSVSVGEVSSRSHTEAESQDHFESSSREFSNPNRCHAVTYYFYQINKTQIVRFRIVAIQRRVIDPAADTRVSNNRFVSDGGVTAIPNAVLATDASRLKVEAQGRESVAAAQRAGQTPAAGFDLISARAVAAADLRADPIDPGLKAKALKQVDDSLMREGLLDDKGQVSEKVIAELSFERVSSLPTPGMLVKGCLDECNVCETALDKSIELDLERKALENELLKKRIELLEKAQEYRCCPVGESEEMPV